MVDDLTHMGHIPGETSITDRFMSNLSKYCHKKKLPIVVRKAPKENINGSDIDLYFARGHDLYMFPVQAKRLYDNGQYQQLYYKDQVENLLSYAKKHNGLAIYMLYNFPYFEGIQPNLTFNGITTTAALNILNLKEGKVSKSYETLHPQYCNPISSFVKDLLNIQFQLKQEKIDKYSLLPCNRSIQSVMESESWVKLKQSIPGINGIPEAITIVREKLVELPVDQDKYLLILGVYDH
jgi:hypothetical protein